MTHHIATVHMASWPMAYWHQRVDERLGNSPQITRGVATTNSIILSSNKIQNGEF